MAQFTPPFAQENTAAPATPAPGTAPPAPGTAPPAPGTAPAAAAPATAPAASEVPPGAAAPGVAAAPATEPVKQKKTIERKATRTINKDDILFVCEHVKGMSYNDMAEKLGLTRHQVNRILMDIKAQLRKSCINAEGVEDPARKDIIEKHIAEHLSRPEDSRVGAKKGSPVRDAMNDVVSEILGNL